MMRERAYGGKLLMLLSDSKIAGDLDRVYFMRESLAQDAASIGAAPLGFRQRAEEMSLGTWRGNPDGGVHLPPVSTSSPAIPNPAATAR
jgi:hypothetical protein